MVLYKTVETVEINALDIQLEATRTKDKIVERKLLKSIIEEGIFEPLVVAHCKDSANYILLDGFKRYRCAKKIDLQLVPITIIAHDPVEGIITLLVRRPEKVSISTLDQAMLVDTLNSSYKLSISEIAVRLKRSPSWVSLRLGMIKSMTPLTREKIMSGAFPARVYMYGIKNFTRVNNIAPEVIDSFVKAASNQKLCTRDLLGVAKAYFSGSETTKRLITDGNIHRAVQLVRAQRGAEDGIGLNEHENHLIQCLKDSTRMMQQVFHRSKYLTYSNRLFLHSVQIWSSAVQKYLPQFTLTVKELYDRSGTQDSSSNIVSPGSNEKADSSASSP
jgi:ParB/RepB/Spo0J family partition protein